MILFREEAIVKNEVKDEVVMLENYSLMWVYRASIIIGIIFAIVGISLISISHVQK